MRFLRGTPVFVFSGALGALLSGSRLAAGFEFQRPRCGRHEVLELFTLTPLYDSMFTEKPALEELSFGPPWNSIPGLEDSFAVALEIAGGCFGMG